MYNSINFTSTSEKTYHIPLKISIVVAKKNRQVTYMYVRNTSVLFDKHNYILVILKKYCYVFSGHVTFFSCFSNFDIVSSQQNDNLLLLLLLLLLFYYT